jgi:hypothetical protein
MAFSALTDHPFYEGEAPAVLLLEGATRAPIIAREPQWLHQNRLMPKDMSVIKRYAGLDVWGIARP